MHDCFEHTQTNSDSLYLGYSLRNSLRAHKTLQQALSGCLQFIINLFEELITEIIEFLNGHRMSDVVYAVARSGLGHHRFGKYMRPPNNTDAMLLKQLVCERR